MELTGNYRHELKYQIGPADHLALRQRLKAVMQQDLHTGADGRASPAGVFQIRRMPPVRLKNRRNCHDIQRHLQIQLSGERFRVFYP